MPQVCKFLSLSVIFVESLTVIKLIEREGRLSLDLACLKQDILITEANKLPFYLS